MPQSQKVSLEDALRMAVSLHREGHLEAAEEVYKKILRVEPELPDALHFFGVLCHQGGQSDKALELMRRAAELMPDNSDLYNNLGNVLKETGRWEEAVKIYQRVIELTPEHADAHCNLGVILRNRGKLQKARKFLKKAIRFDPVHVDAHHNLGNVYSDLKQFDKAIASYRKAIELGRGKEKSEENLANALHRQGKVDEAIRVLREWLAKSPDSAVARHMLAAFTGDDVPARASDEYVRDTFDGFASSFDEVLYRLKYRAPHHVAACLGGLFPETGARLRILDAGCGTGLVGPLIKPYAAHMVGLDLSPVMLSQAKRRKVYDRLEEAELTAYMASCEEPFDVITCVDTLVYFGDLGEVLPAANNALRAGGWFVFTLERAGPDQSGESGYHLNRHGRYGHSRQYVEAALGLAGFANTSVDDVVLRKEGSEQVDGMLFAAQKAH